MVMITQSAAAELKTIIEAESRSKQTNCGLRVCVSGMDDHGVRYGLELDEINDDMDVVIDLGEIKMLIDQKIAPSLQNIVIDFMETCDERGFVISNPALCCRCG
ncbi:MAG: HesB/IscA family protein [Candidatus Methanogasteraceae archaeon]